MGNKVKKIMVPGKLILTGEHSVVYGEPAVAAAVNLGVMAEVEKIIGDGVGVESVNWNIRARLGEEEVEKELKLARDNWMKFDKVGEIGILKEWLTENRLRLGIAALGIAAERWGWPEGMGVKLSGDLAVGSGMGSSAAVAAAVMRAVARYQGERVNPDELVGMVYETEKFIHGRPGGIDNAVVVYTGVVVKQKGKVVPIDLQSELPAVVLIQSGVPEETTGEVVAMVRERVENEGKRVEKIIQEIGRISNQVLAKLKSESELEMGWVTENERLLEELGVVSEKGKMIIDVVEKAGGVAKICGAGGIRQGSGIIMAYGADQEKLERLMQEKGFEVLRAKLGYKGENEKEAKFDHKAN